MTVGLRLRVQSRTRNTVRRLICIQLAIVQPIISLISCEFAIQEKDSADWISFLAH